MCVVLKNPFQLAIRFHERRWDLLAVLLLFVSYLVIYRDVAVAPYLITGVDFQIPTRTPYIPWTGFFTPWSEFSNGFPYGTNFNSYGALLNGLFVVVSNGNLVLAQKFMLSSVFFASVFMYAFIRKHIARKRVVALTGAIIYAYGVSSVNYGTGIVWEYAFFPLVVYFLFNLLGSGPRFRDAALFAISLDLMIGYGIHLMVFLPLLAIAFFLLNLHGSHDKTGYCKRSMKLLSEGLVLFLLSAPSFSLTLISLIPLPITIPGRALAESTVSSVTVSQFYNNYGSIPLLNWFLLLGPYSEYIRPLVAVVGFVFPILAASALIQRRSHSSKLALGFSTVLVMVLTLVVLIQWKTSTFVWLFSNFPPIRVLQGAEGVEFITSFLVTTLISITLSELAQTIERRLNVVGNKKALISRRLVTITLFLILLLGFFLFVPAFDPQQHLRGEGYTGSSRNSPVPVDSSYSLIFDWLNRQTEPGTFRYLVMPSLFSASLALSYSTSPFWFEPSPGLPATSQYAYYSLGALLSGQTHRWGLILAPANVRYIVVIWNTTETNFGSGATESMGSGNPALQSGPSLSGDYRNYLDLLGAQNDLKVVANESNYLIYENLDYLSHEEVFPSLSYIVGDLSSINDVALASDFSANRSMLVYGDQQSPQPPLPYADTVIFQNRNITDLALDNLSIANGIALSSYGDKQRIDIDHSWVQATPENNYIVVQGLPTSGLLSPQSTFIETTGRSALRVNFTVSSEGMCDVWLSVLFCPQCTGVMRFLIDGQLVNLTVRPNRQVFDGFEWINLGTLKLNSGLHMITIENSDGYNALSVLQIIAPDTVEQEESVLSAMLATKSITYFFDDPGLFDVGFSNASRTVSSYDLSQYVDGYSLGNLSIVSDGVVAPLSVQNVGPAISASPRQALGFIFPSEDRNFTGWDYMELWVKTSTTQTQVYLYNDLHKNIYHYFWAFSTNPGVWNRLLIPLEGNFSYIDGIQVHAVTDTPGQNVTIELNQINLVKVDASMSIQTYLPSANDYSIDYLVSQTGIAPTLAIDGKPIPVTTVDGSNVSTISSYDLSQYVDGYSLGNLSIVSDGVVAPLSVQNVGPAISASPRQALGFIFPSEDRNFTGWDYMELWVKTSTTQTQVYLYNDLHKNIYHYFWAFSTNPGVWNRLLIPLEGNFSYIDGIQVHAVTDTPGQNVTIELNQINLVKVANDYSIDYNMHVWSSPVYLTPGYHNFTLTASGASSPASSPLCLTISDWNLTTASGEPEMTSVTNYGNTEYTVNVTSYKPFYLMLGESYDNSWRAYLNGSELPHFYAYSYLNGYYVNETGTISIVIKYNGQNYLTIAWVGLGMFVFLLIYVTVDTMLRRQPRKHTQTNTHATSFTHSEG
jgi:hypothetical protein